MRPAIVQISSEGPFIAEIVTWSGDARVRRVGELNWQTVTSPLRLMAGDRLYSGNNSSIQLKFYGDTEAVLTMSQGSIFELGRSLPINTRIGRSLREPSSQAGGAAGSEGGRSTFLAPDRGENIDDASAGGVAKSKSLNQAQSGAGGLMLEWKIKDLPIVFPEQSKLQIRSKNFPVTIRVALDPEGGRTLGTLWEVSNGNVTVWSGVSRSFFEAIPIPNAGEFAFQAFSENGLMRTTRLKIVAESISGEAHHHILPDVLNQEEMIYLP